MRRQRNKGDKLRYTIVREAMAPYRYVLSVWKGKTIYRVEKGSKSEMQALRDRWKTQEKKNPRPGMPGRRVVKGKIVTIKNAKRVSIARLPDGRIGILTVRNGKRKRRAK